ncbi:MAG: hypothetical protein OEZ36_11430 [Spirochaetota bacterium]|nr:hypothetical protein [Spirochaetota bacterium]
MKLNDIQKTDFHRGLEQLAYSLSTADLEELDIRSVENRIQQALGVINLLETLSLRDERFKKVIINGLKKLYQRRKELLFGHERAREEIRGTLVSCG